MQLQTIILIYFCVFILSLSFLYLQKRENFCKLENNVDKNITKTNKKWAIVLTTAIDLHNHNERKKIISKTN
jgi:hypothetical protein